MEPLQTCSDSADAVCMLRKTEKPDIYEVFANNTKAGIAYIAGLAMSKRMHTIFKDRTVAVQVPFKCRFNATFQKWEPLEMA
jgi:hypothetical protein